MALSIYVGPPGSGKTYNAVESVAVPAARSGRTIITNIRGIVPEIWSDRLGCDTDKIVVVDDEWFKNEAHYPKMGEQLLGGIPSGALVLVDEAYTVFPPGNILTSRMIEWVRTHRHFVSDGGVATDLVLISQDVMSIHPRVRSCVEYVSAVRNLRHVGFGKRFRVDVYGSWRMTKSTFIGQTFHKYDNSVFDLYKSFEAEGAAKVVFTDKKQRAIKTRHIIFLLFASLLVGYAATRISTAVHALKASEIGNQSLPVPLIVAARPFNATAACATVGGVIIDIESKEGFFDGGWKKVQVMGDGSWRLGDVCTFYPGDGGRNGRTGRAGS
ncbi:zonular occludens toxin domain-containing protein [Sphingomonas sp.]|uniref:zonular occludens toxin domain-containing protein n=1 Tax=Sphingomonas sp. TaxID=28214 RepID=UPI003D6CBBDC